MLKEYPHSLIITGFAINSLTEIGFKRGAADRASARLADGKGGVSGDRRLLSIGKLEWALSRCDNRASLGKIEETISELFMGLNNRS